ncbi:ApeA N-terminal domain 1-containing protein [Mycolicibacterium palauense]|uniref:ApeA N-terminal domain 1-containing protein n=1 Tax=Mycolicibacterium palauense TaxID=2034511 RepID=UPI001FE540AA|nr:HEPN domain-containing protein [Mycolicibacterium palauense]
MTGKFPVEPNTTLGQFWLPGAEDRAVTGLLQVDDADVRVEVSPGLTPMFAFEITGPGRGTQKLAEDPLDMVVLGSIPVQPNRVSIWDAFTTNQRTLLNSPFTADQPSVQELRATWCLLGEHLPDPETRFCAIRLDVTNLSEWAWIPALATTIYPDNRLKLDWHLDLAGKSLDAELLDGTGYITLGPGATHRPPGIRGFNVNTYSQFEIELFDGWTGPELVERALIPMSDLMTLLSGAECLVRSLEVWSSERWCSVYGYHVSPGAAQSAGEVFLHQPHVGFDFLARWLDLHFRLTPVPQILAAFTRREFPTVEAEALSLVTAVEALHRTLYPDARRFTTDQIDKSLDAVAGSEIPEPVAVTMTSALRQYWHEYSYPQRVRALAEPVSNAVPTCIGRLGRWKNAVVEQRISLAHGLTQRRMPAEQILKMSALNRSVYWMLVFRLLLEAGIPPALLAEKSDEYQRFRNDRDQWRRHLPDVFS